MGTVIRINSNATQKVKPNILSFSITIRKEGQDATTLMDEMAKIRESTKQLIINADTYRNESYIQKNVNMSKRYKTEHIYSDGITEISDSEYEKLPYSSKNKFSVYKTKKIFLGYYADVSISANLDIDNNNISSTIKDFTDLYNYCINNEYTFNYESGITESYANEILDELYINCINMGIERLNTIVSGVSTMKNKTISILEIVDPQAISESSYRNNNTFGNARACMREEAIRGGVSSVEAEQIITPELVKDVLQTPTVCDYQLTIVAEIN
ncbi:MAG: hypothetical protein VZS44_08225 [Bacilli bacterium]|nr:hypothetical protein [Bacilli bacterium]